MRVLDLVLVCRNRDKSPLESALLHRHDSCLAALHDSCAAFHRSTGTVVLNRHRGKGCVTADYDMHFGFFNTFVADVKLYGGCFYFELEAKGPLGEDVDDDEYDDQLGFCTHGFEAREEARKRSEDGSTRGDAACWGVGVNCCLNWSKNCDESGKLLPDMAFKLHENDFSYFGTGWNVGDVIGFALDMRTAGAAVMSISVNGSFAAPNGVVFNSIDAPYLSPSFTGRGTYRVNFGDRPFAHAPPDAQHISVHAFNKSHP